jgi:hypothetical protein
MAVAVYYTETTDIMDSDFFHYLPAVQLGCRQALTALNLTGPTFTNIDGLTKSFYSILLTDLDQTSKTNILAHPHLLLEFQKLTCINDLVDPQPPAHIFQNQTSFINYYGQSELIGVAGIPSVSPAVIAAVFLPGSTTQINRLTPHRDHRDRTPVPPGTVAGPESSSHVRPRATTPRSEIFHWMRGASLYAARRVRTCLESRRGGK